jgi:hypothetical protein
MFLVKKWDDDDDNNDDNDDNDNDIPMLGNGHKSIPQA